MALLFLMIISTNERGEVAKDAAGIDNIERFARNFARLLKRI